MATLIGENFFKYFSQTQHPQRAQCKMCEKILNSKVRSNLKKHLRFYHKVEIRLQKKPGYKNNSADENSFNHTKLESHQSNCRDSVSLPPPSPTIDIKEEVLQPSNIQEITPKIIKTKEIGLNGDENDINPLRTRTLETHYEPDSDDSAEDLPPANNDEYVEPIAKKEKMDPLNEPTLSQKQRMNKTSNFRVDPLREQHASSPKEDSLERALRKRKMLLEIEQLQIQNYEMKLKLWEKEQLLQMPHSRFTKEIAARKRAIEEEYYEAH